MQAAARQLVNGAKRKERFAAKSGIGIPIPQNSMRSGDPLKPCRTNQHVTAFRHIAKVTTKHKGNFIAYRVDRFRNFRLSVRRVLVSSLTW
jgi:hypothetical protein